MLSKLHKLVIIILVFFIIINNFVIYCEEAFSIQENIKHFPSTLSTPSGNISRIDRSHYENEVERKFIIRSNVIIRTGESRALGAKYINETRLPSNHDCLIWCLETSSCNAAVFEEKNTQSCYLFECGSPAKPLCKFTPHNFFISSVLKMTQHSYELSQWGKQVQQERANTEHHNDISTTTPVSVNKNISTSPLLPTSSGQQFKKDTVCHHYQFQCLNNSECIAIYNVCDGIPQCPDESDESPDLKCPIKDASKQVINEKERIVETQSPLESKAPPLKLEPPSVRPSPTFSNLQNVPSYKKSPEHKEAQHINYKGIWPPSYSVSPKIKTGYHRHMDDPDSLGSPFIHKHSQFISANDPHVQNLNRWASDYDQYPPHATSMEQQYNPYDRVDDQFISNQMSSDYDSAKTFPGYHQEDISFWPNQDIIQDSSYTIDEFPQSGVQSLNKGVVYPDKENIYAQQISRNAEQYPETKLSMHKPLLNQNQPPDIDEYNLRRYPHSRQQQPYLNLDEAMSQRFYPEMKTKSYDTLQNADESLYDNDDLIRASLVNQLPKNLDRIRHPPKYKLKHFDKDMLRPVSKESSIFQSTEAPEDDNSLIIVKPTSQSTHAKSIQRTVLDFKMSVAELYQSSTTHSHEANSAILALVLGVTISFFLMILLACRLKTLRRRMSRKGRALAHDADYLVNGMYL